jgi:hypothetical protein
MADLNPVFTALRKIMAPYATQLSATRDDEQELYLDTQHIQKIKSHFFLGLCK